MLSERCTPATRNRSPARPTAARVRISTATSMGGTCTNSTCGPGPIHRASSSPTPSRSTAAETSPRPATSQVIGSGRLAVICSSTIRVRSEAAYDRGVRRIGSSCRWRRRTRRHLGHATMRASSPTCGKDRGIRRGSASWLTERNLAVVVSLK